MVQERHYETLFKGRMEAFLASSLTTAVTKKYGTTNLLMIKKQEVENVSVESALTMILLKNTLPSPLGRQCLSRFLDRTAPLHKNNKIRPEDSTHVYSFASLRKQIINCLLEVAEHAHSIIISEMFLLKILDTIKKDQCMRSNLHVRNDLDQLDVSSWDYWKNLVAGIQGEPNVRVLSEKTNLQGSMSGLLMKCKVMFNIQVFCDAIETINKWGLDPELEYNRYFNFEQDEEILAHCFPNDSLRIYLL